MQNELLPFVKTNNEIFLKQDEGYVCEDFLHRYLDTNKNENPRGYK